MQLLTIFLGSRAITNLLIFASGDKAVSFGLYEIRKSLTPIGWIVVVGVPLTLIFGTILAVIFLKKRNLK